jgi:hypothetical protein
MSDMPKVPQIVYDRMQAAQPGPAHPAADLLAAFAEQALSAAERNGVLEHLALCGDCREVIALALPDAEVVSPPIADNSDAVRATGSRSGAPASHKLSLSWPSLRWAALAAGVVLAGSVLLMRPGKLNQATTPSVSPLAATTAQPVPAPRAASSQLALAATASSPIGQAAISAKTGATRPESELQSSRKPKPATPPLPAQYGMMLAENKKASVRAYKLAPPPTASAGALAFDASTSRTANEAVGVYGAAAAVEPAPSAAGSLMAQNETRPILKAKPAPQPANNGLQDSTSATIVQLPVQGRTVTSARQKSPAKQTSTPNVTWTIAAGVLQRSQDGGQSWQSALRPDHPLVCYVSHEADVWAGGQAGTLFHSPDGGITWVRVQPAIKGQQLSADVTHIDVDDRSPAAITVLTSNNETWSSTDGGTTWQKR